MANLLYNNYFMNYCSTNITIAGLTRARVEWFLCPAPPREEGDRASYPSHHHRSYNYSATPPAYRTVAEEAQDRVEL